MEKPNFWNFEGNTEKIKELYNDPDNLAVIEFSNRTNIRKLIWVEPSCVTIEVEANTEYQILTHDKSFRIEFDLEYTLIFYLQYSFGFILNKRAISNAIPNPNPWILDMDSSDIN